MRLLQLFTIALVSIGMVNADVYMHNMRGSNNRLDEANRDRANGNRLFDSQNNNRGGYNVGSLYFYEGSELDLSWTNQHSCGDLRLMCEMIIQYTCDPLLRDGTVTNTIPTDNNQCLNNNCDTDVTYGRHESQQYYAECKYRQRNQGLFLATQNLQGNGAIYTRQNPNGNRHGYECPEERDYYPYWGPTPWRDAAVLTNQPSRCAAYQSESQNVKSRFYCATSQGLKDEIAKKKGNNGIIPITKTECELLSAKVNNKTENGTWIEVPAWNIPPPICHATQFTRDNHLGNTIGGFPAGFNWTIPSISAFIGVDNTKCVLRIRYNITTGDFGTSLSDGAGTFASAKSIQVGTVDASDNKKVKDNVNNRFPATLDIWSKYGLNNYNATYATTLGVSGKSVYDSFQQNTNNPDNAAERRNTREYVVKNNPNVDIFGTLLPVDKRGNVKTQLAINTAQYPRTFQDRSHRFATRAAPAGIIASSIKNLNVQGKRGNIVQVYPGVEYDFIPNRLHLAQGEYVHIQWTGSNSNPNHNAGQGQAGSDRSNMAIIVPKKYDENQKLTNPPTYGQWGAVYPNRIDSQRIGGSMEKGLLGLTDPLTLQHLAILDVAGGQFGGSMDELNDAGTYFDGGLIRANVMGIYHYLCTRNNNFSNRDQKGKIVVQAQKTNTISLDKNELNTKIPGTSPKTPSTDGTSNSTTSNDNSGGAGNDVAIYIPPNPERPPSTLIMDQYPSHTPSTLGSVSSNYIVLSGLVDTRTTIWLPFDGKALSTSTVYYGVSMEGPWTVAAATIDGDMATITASQDGVYVVQTKTNTTLIIGIAIGCTAFLALVIAASVFLYRRRHSSPKKNAVAQVTKHEGEMSNYQDSPIHTHVNAQQAFTNGISAPITPPAFRWTQPYAPDNQV